ncbi:MAG: UDP-N-acetylmuramoylalanine/D-glutamate ligase [Gammaproteobacteria bacterium]|nr:UDP-N-acetylmuramoylalanine/D-glutamate ligase [Gammaproteobacteria bacterium]
MSLAINHFTRMTNVEKKFDLVILGLGKTGISCARFFSGRNMALALMDSRMQPPGLEMAKNSFPEIPVYLGQFDQNVLLSARELIVSPGIPISDPAISLATSAGVAVAGDIEIFCRHATSPIVAVTGSNGKSTVASLIHKMIEASGRSAKLGGNIGTPALDLLQGPEPEFYVLELSSFQLETTSSLDAAAAVVLNISEDHMDRYANLQEYAIAKFRIYDGSGTLVINLDDKMVGTYFRKNRKSICFTAMEPDKNTYGVRKLAGQEVIAWGDDVICPVKDIPIQGRHNIANTLAALSLGTAIGLPMPGMLAGLRDFVGLPHRCQWLQRINGVDWYNDSKGTNVGASCAAIEGLAGDNNLILIAGGDGKGADFAPLASAVVGRVRAAILIGRDAQRLAAVLGKVTAVYFALDMDAAVRLAHEQSRPQDIVLLSPACASLDMFSDYQHRGAVFAQAVARIEQA